jgi:hypothetical protein
MRLSIAFTYSINSNYCRAFDNLKSLDQVASSLTAARIMQSHLLVELVDY